jgi:hypothetical protein
MVAAAGPLPGVAQAEGCLTGGEQAQFVISDPPYNVPIEVLLDLPRNRVFRT